MQKLISQLTELGHNRHDPARMLHSFLNVLAGEDTPLGVAMITACGGSNKQVQIAVALGPDRAVWLASALDKDTTRRLPVYNASEFGDLLDLVRPVLSTTASAVFEGLDPARTCPCAGAFSLPLQVNDDKCAWLCLFGPDLALLRGIDPERALLLANLVAAQSARIEDSRKLQYLNQRLEAELQAAAQVQRLLLPQNLSQLAGLTTAVHFAPYSKVGGDHYDVRRLPGTEEDDRAWDFMIADASGHGSAAALEISMYDAILRTYSVKSEQGPAGVFNYANRYLFTRSIRAAFITAFVGNYHSKRRQLAYCNAGHLAPILKPVHPGAELRRLDDGSGIPLGIDQDATWTSEYIDMEPGDLLVLYTDGITEARSSDGEFFGIERLESIIATQPNDPAELLRTIETALLSHQGDTPQHDDQTLLILQVEPD